MIDLLYAQSGTSIGSSPLGVFLPFVLVILIFYFLLIRPQAKRQKALDRKRENIKKGDVFITSGGLYAKTSHFKSDGKVVVAELSKDVRVEVVRSTIMDVLGTAADVAAATNKNTKQKSAQADTAGAKKTQGRQLKQTSFCLSCVSCVMPVFTTALNSI